MKRLAFLANYPGLIPFIALMALFLATNAYFILLSHQKYLDEEYHDHFHQEMKLIKEVLNESILQDDLTNIEKFLLQWGKSQHEIVEMRVVMANGTLLMAYQRLQPAEAFLVHKETLYSQQKKILTLHIKHDLDFVSDSIRGLTTTMWAISTFITTLFGLALWGLLRQTAVIPLEQEVAKRQEAENKTLEAFSELKRNRDSLVKSQQIARLGNWDWDIVNNTVSWSDEIYTIFGYTDEGFPATYEGFLQAVHPDDRMTVQQAISQALEDPSVNYNLEHRVCRPSGVERTVHEMGEVFWDDGGEPVRMVGTVQDITERRSYEQKLAVAYAQLKDRESHIRAILDNALDAIITIEKNGLIREFNPAAEKLFGFSAQEAVGKDVADLIIPDEYRQAHLSALSRHAAETDIPPVVKRRVEVSGKRADGKMVDLEIGLTAMYRGGKLNYTGFLRDITDRKQLLMSLQDTLEVAESANRSKDEFLANMSHEIRSPMNAIMGMTELVLMSDLTADQQENLEIVHNSANQLLGLINDVLDFSKIEAGQLCLEQHPFDLRGRVESSCEGLAVQAHQKELELFCDIAPDIPPLIGDALRLNQIVTNLVNNAIKFTLEGEVMVCVDRVEEAGAGEETVLLHFRVVDTGVGIPVDRTAVIFEQFTQGDGSTTRKYGGTGLGLTISKRLVEMMEGEIWLESEEGAGSTVHFTARFGRGKQTGLPPPHPVPPSSSHLQGVRLLIGDRNKCGRRVVGRMVTDHGGEVVQADSRLSLLSSLTQASEEKRPFDLVVLDQAFSVSEFSEKGSWEQSPLGRSKILLMIPTHIQVAELTSSTRMAKVGLVKKPVKLSSLLKGIDQLLGRAVVEPDRGDDAFSVISRDGKPLHILLVDDLVNNQKLAAGLLEKRGHVVALAQDGQEALEKLALGRYDLVLMDLQMPIMDGYQATEQIRRGAGVGGWDPQIPIIAVTARIMPTEEKKCLAVGMNGYLRKPYRGAELLRAIEPYIKRDKPKRKTGGKKAKMPILIPTEGEAVRLQSYRETLLQEGPKRLKGLRQALVERQSGKMLKEAGWFKVAGSNVGAARLNVKAIRLYGKVEMKNWDDASSLIDDLDIEFEKVVRALAQRESGL
ncbi:MAG: PAS domain S-box protein [Magnetococcales bacterium]|nr:PAS domain S-box protein [Magnetococcales bacterium]